MRRVTLYRAVAETVLAGDKVELYEHSAANMDMSIASVRGSPQAVCSTVKKIELPVVHLCTDNGKKIDCEFFALDPTVERLVAHHKQSRINAENLAEQRLHDFKLVERELCRLKSLNFWQRVRRVFKPNH